MTKQSTIKDIAKALGMHHTTVSRALRNHPDVNEKTRKEVLAMAEKMNYVPNSFATNLRSQKSNSIGLLIPDITAGFFAKTTSIITNLAYEAGYSVVICQSNEDLEWERKNVDMLIQNRVAGVLVSLCRESSDLGHVDKLKQADVPVVFFDRVPEIEDVNKVMLDNFSVGYESAKKLIESGKTKIGFYVGNEEVKVFNERLEGYRKAMADNKLDMDMSLIFKGGLKVKDGIAMGQQVLAMDQQPEAIISVVDQVAIGLIQVLAEAGVKIPDDFAIIGCDNDSGSSIVIPQLSTFDPPVKDLCKMAFNMLKENIEGLKETQTQTLAMKYIERKTT